MNSKTIAISLNKVSKNYNLYSKPSDRVKETFHPFKKKYCTPFTALNSISLEVGVGETIGIVGRNGCGKSTLLQIVCGIMPPTSGEFTVNGRISAILELGAGFNQEFTGRDNVFLNCSILGMDKNTIEARMESILAFADIGTFIDQPVKTYSSGMTMRLAFSIAISVDPAILIVDEALAVGDAAFQRKCYSKIQLLQKQGATILFVSHDAGAIVELCNRAVLIDGGDMIYEGNPKKVISLYHKLLFASPEKVEDIKKQIVAEINETKFSKKNQNPAEKNILQETDTRGDEDKAYLNRNLVPKSTIWYEPNGATISNPRILTLDDEEVNVLLRNDEYYFAYDLNFSDHAFNIRPGMSIKTLRGFDLGGYGRSEVVETPRYVAPGSKILVKLKFQCSLLPGSYFLNAGVIGIVDSKERYLHRGVDILMFEVAAEKHIAATGIVDFSISPQLILQGAQEA